MTSIIRIKKEVNYSIISNDLLVDPSLSWKATGLLSYLLHLPDDWNISTADLQKRKTDGRDSTKAALKELVDAGYVIYKKSKDESGKWKHEYFVHEKPQTEKPQTENPSTGKPSTENPSIIPSTKQPSTKSNTNTNVLGDDQNEPTDSKPKPLNKQTEQMALIDDLAEEYPKLKVKLFDYWRIRVSKGLTTKQWSMILDDLRKYSKDERDMLNYLDTAFSGGYMTIIPPWVKNDQKKRSGKKSTDNTGAFEREQAKPKRKRELATDEDGKPIVF